MSASSASPLPCSETHREPGENQTLDIDPDDVGRGLGQLVLTIVKLLQELMERQAIRRMEAGSLTDQEMERLGLTFEALSLEMERLKRHFGLEEEDLNLDLGPLGKLF